MTQNRYCILANTNTEDRHRNRGKLHKKERKRGWHYCHEDDGLLTPHTPLCNCNGYGKRKLARKAKPFEQAERRYQDYLCDLADANSY